MYLDQIFNHNKTFKIFIHNSNNKLFFKLIIIKIIKFNKITANYRLIINNLIYRIKL
jgi:hypothetical protein